jgi:hypothetical protein
MLGSMTLDKFDYNIVGRVKGSIALIWSTRRLIYPSTVLNKLPRLPGLTNRLVKEVLTANPNTVVVNQSGTPVTMPWINEASTLVQVGVRQTGLFLPL